MERLQDTLEYERRFWSRGLLGVAGVDEVGRGPLAGPVIAAAVVLPEGTEIEGATDSKVLGPVEREELSALILAHAQGVTLGAASVREIDRANILVATAWAMNRALDRLPSRPDHVVVDGLPMRSLRWKHEALVGRGRARTFGGMRFDRGKGVPGSAHGQTGRAISRVRLGSQHGLRYRGAPRRVGAFRSHSAPPADVPGFTVRVGAVGASWGAWV